MSHYSFTKFITDLGIQGFSSGEDLCYYRNVSAAIAIHDPLDALSVREEGVLEDAASASTSLRPFRAHVASAGLDDTRGPSSPLDEAHARVFYRLCGSRAANR
jgi:hypothetical protein